jgi:hypothetical protein
VFLVALAPEIQEEEHLSCWFLENLRFIIDAFVSLEKYLIIKVREARGFQLVEIKQWQTIVQKKRSSGD